MSLAVSGGPWVRVPSVVVAMFMLGASLALVVPNAEAQRPVAASTGEQPLYAVGEIANGILTTLPPSVVWVDGSCTGTLIGCSTVLTAAHCVCGEDDTGQTCQPEASFVFLQHAGQVAVSSVTVHPDYEFGVESDLAVLKLAQTVTNVQPTPINTTGKPAPGSSGLIVGFGLDGSGNDALDGLKRQGLVVTESCSQGIPDPAHLCWSFDPPPGPAGQDSNTCPGDSGGPLFVDFGSGIVVAGVTSGGTGECDQDDLAFDADVFRDRAWIQQQAGADLGRTCGTEAPAGSALSPIFAASGTLGAGTPTATFALNVPAGTRRLRVTLNGPLDRDFDLFGNPGTQVDPATAPCASELVSNLEECEIPNPTPGPWRLQASQFDGSGPFQLTATLFGAQAGPPPAADCVPDATTLCIDDQPGDRRFRVRLAFDSVLGGGISGDALAQPLASLGITRGGILAFTNPANPEALVKVLNGCAINGHFWVFSAAATTVGHVLTVEDTEKNAAKSYVNPDQTPAVTVTDTVALATCP